MFGFWIFLSGMDALRRPVGTELADRKVELASQMMILKTDQIASASREHPDPEISANSEPSWSGSDGFLIFISW